MKLNHAVPGRPIAMQTLLLVAACLLSPACRDPMAVPLDGSIVASYTAFVPDTANLVLTYGPGPLYSVAYGALTSGRPNQYLIAYDTLALGTAKPATVIVQGYRETQADGVKFLLVGTRGNRISAAGAVRAGDALAAVDERKKIGWFTDTVSVSGGTYDGYHLQVELKGVNRAADARFLQAELLTN